MLNYSVCHNYSQQSSEAETTFISNANPICQTEHVKLGAIDLSAERGDQYCAGGGHHY